MHEAGFEEVETPVLQNIYGGASAEPFTTHLNALKQEMFLRIALEISLKKLIVGGMPKVFEIGKIFRNEGIDRTHNPEFTMMDFVEKIFEEVALNVFGDTKIRFTSPNESTACVIDLSMPWKRISMIDAIKTYGGLDVSTMSDSDMKAALLKQTHIDPKTVHPATRGELIAMLFEEFAAHHRPPDRNDTSLQTAPRSKASCRRAR
jgi:lysyl-tRNA synthetase class 2